MTDEIQQVPEPDPTPPPPPPNDKVILECKGCGAQYPYEVEPQYDSFTIVCQRCKTRIKWER